ncbi:HV323 protein, partial [Atractosteus spatula]|nr:HV323 protein [Atractosteus spatula]
LTESEPAVKKPGESHTLSCTASGFTFKDWCLDWVRQITGKAPEWLARVCTGSNPSKYYAQSVQGRFTISRDDSSSKLFLQMSSLKTEDTAVYHCCKVAQ